MTKKPLIICMMGPTATGKTDLALALADVLPLDIISVDSAMVYQTMDIGTAKPSVTIRQAYPHGLVDIRDPVESYSASDFRQDALDLIEKSVNQGRIPLLVGGTMLYFKALIHGLGQSLPQADLAIRSEIEQQANVHGWRYIHDKLQSLDRESAHRIHPNDRQRLGRALEVCLITGKKFSQLRNEVSADHNWHGQVVGQDRDSRYGASNLPYRILQCAISIEDRSFLHQRIHERFLAMLNNGLIDEVSRLYQRQDLNPTLPSIRCVGYRQVWQYLAGVLNYPQMVEKGVIATRQLAKHQLTWLRSWQNLHRFGVDDNPHLSRSLHEKIKQHLEDD